MHGASQAAGLLLIPAANLLSIPAAAAAPKTPGHRPSIDPQPPLASSPHCTSASLSWLFSINMKAKLKIYKNPPKRHCGPLMRFGLAVGRAGQGQSGQCSREALEEEEP